MFKTAERASAAADQCRMLARTSLTEEAATVLTAMATDFDLQAEELRLGSSTPKTIYPASANAAPVPVR